VVPEERPSDFHDAKGAAEALLKALGLRDLVFKKGRTPPWYLKEASAAILLGDQALGALGQVSPEALRRFDVDATAVFVFEIDATVLIEKVTGDRAFEPLAKFPAVYRDLSIIAKRSVESARIQEIILREGRELVESVALFDLFEGGKIDPWKKPWLSGYAIDLEKPLWTAKISTNSMKALWKESEKKQAPG